jgi:hypothetical protein
LKHEGTLVYTAGVPHECIGGGWVIAQVLEERGKVGFWRQSIDKKLQRPKVREPPMGWIDCGQKYPQGSLPRRIIKGGLRNWRHQIGNRGPERA